MLNINTHVDLKTFKDSSSELEPRGRSCSPIEREVDKVDVVLQPGRQLGEAPGGAVHYAVAPAAGAHRGADGHHPTSQQQEEEGEGGGGHGRGSGGRETSG